MTITSALNLKNAQRAAAYTAGLFNARGTTDLSTEYRFLAGWIVMLRDVPTDEQRRPREGGDPTP